MRYVLTFASVHFVMKSARLLKRERFDVIVIPIPRKISSECGMALEVQFKQSRENRDCLQPPSEDVERIKGLLENEGCGMTGVYEL